MLPNFLLRFFIPHEFNNHRAHLIHPISISFLTSAIILMRMFLPLSAKIAPVVVGYEAHITPEEIVELTNIERKNAGMSEVELDPILTKAALVKASDMMARDYWSHNTPDGKQPWIFLAEVGYQYRYAGENLARDFSSSVGVVEGWMNSPSHKENLLSPRYRDMGVAIVEGDLGGVRTTLVVQFFGTRMGDTLLVQDQPSKESTVAAGTLENSKVTAAGAILTLEEGKRILLSPLNATKKISFLLLGLILTVFLVDLIVIKYKKTLRVSSRSFAHFLFLGVVLILVLVAKEGIIR